MELSFVSGSGNTPCKTGNTRCKTGNTPCFRFRKHPAKGKCVNREASFTGNRLAGREVPAAL